MSPTSDEPGAPAQRLVAAPEPASDDDRRRRAAGARRPGAASSRPATRPPAGSRSCARRARSDSISPTTNATSGAATSTPTGAARTCAALARRLYDPIYKYWFRAEWEGLEHIPRDGGALLVANHAGAIPADAPVIMHGIEQELHRPVYGLAENLFRAIPVVGTMWSRLGGVAAHPDNAFRLLHDDHQLVLVFPEGTKGTGKTYRDRYKLHRFGRAGFVEIAMRSGVPVIPIAVVGNEEAMPIMFKSRRIAALLNIPYAPVTANMLAFGPLGAGIYFPAKFRIRVLPPVHFGVTPDQERYPRRR